MSMWQGGISNTGAVPPKPGLPPGVTGLGATIPSDDEKAKLQQNRDAYARLQALFQTYGLGPDAAQWALQQLEQGFTEDVVLQSLYEQPFFDKRFPYYKAMRNAGLPVLTPAEMLRTETDYKRLQRSFGHPVSSNPNDYLNLFVNQVSPNEFEKRLDDFDKLRNIYGPHLRNAFEMHAGITQNVNDEQLYSLLSGQNPDLARQYASQTGTNPGGLSFTSIEDSLTQAQSEERAFARAGGEIAGGVGGSEEERLLRERQLALPTPTPATNP